MPGPRCCSCSQDSRSLPGCCVCGGCQEGSFWPGGHHLSSWAGAIYGDLRRASCSAGPLLSFTEIPLKLNPTTAVASSSSPLSFVWRELSGTCLGPPLVPSLAHPSRRGCARDVRAPLPGCKQRGCSPPNPTTPSGRIGGRQGPHAVGEGHQTLSEREPRPGHLARVAGRSRLAVRDWIDVLHTGRRFPKPRGERRGAGPPHGPEGGER